MADRDIENDFFEDIGRIPPITTDEEQKLLKAIREGKQPASKFAFERMLTGNIPLCISEAASYVGRGVDRLDLIQVGILGMRQALENFDLSKNCRFSTYAAWRIRGEMKREVGRQRREDARFGVSLESPYSNSEDAQATVGDMLPDHSNMVDSIIQREVHHDVTHSVRDTLPTIPELERRVMEMLAGINGYERPHSLAEIQQVLELSPKKAKLTRDRGFMIMKANTSIHRAAESLDLFPTPLTERDRENAERFLQGLGAIQGRPRKQ